MPFPFDLDSTVTYRGRPVTVVSRLCVSGEWLYGIRLRSGRVLDYVPARMLAQ